MRKTTEGRVKASAINQCRIACEAASFCVCKGFCPSKPLKMHIKHRLQLSWGELCNVRPPHYASHPLHWHLFFQRYIYLITHKHEYAKKRAETWHTSRSGQDDTTA